VTSMARRCAGVVVAGALVGACGGAERAPTAASVSTTVATTIATSTIAPSTTAPAPPVGPQRVVLLGDSIMFDLVPAFVSAFGSAGIEVDDSTFGNLGITSTTWDWRGAWLPVVDAAQPDLVVVHSGPWDASVIAPTDLDASLGPEDAPLTAAFLASARAVTDELTRRGVTVVWLTSPAWGTASGFALDLAPVNAALATLASERADVEVVDIAGRLADGAGGFRQFGPGASGTDVELRKPDEAHLCPDGAVVAVQLTIDSLAQRWTVPIADGWENGLWRTDDRYRQPAHGNPCLSTSTQETAP
jgi:hypothetical protein